MTTVSSTNYL